MDGIWLTIREIADFCDHKMKGPRLLAARAKKQRWDWRVEPRFWRQKQREAENAASRTVLTTRLLGQAS